jgi:hypothetical protein
MKQSTEKRIWLDFAMIEIHCKKVFMLSDQERS